MTEVNTTVSSYKKHLERYLDREGDDIKILHCFKKLKKLPITLQTLQDTEIGKVVNCFRKHDGNVGTKAKELVHQWKNLVSFGENNSDDDESRESTPSEYLRDQNQAEEEKPKYVAECDRSKPTASHDTTSGHTSLEKDQESYSDIEQQHGSKKSVSNSHTRDKVDEVKEKTRSSKEDKHRSKQRAHEDSKNNRKSRDYSEVSSNHRARENNKTRDRQNSSRESSVDHESYSDTGQQREYKKNSSNSHERDKNHEIKDKTRSSKENKHSSKQHHQDDKNSRKSRDTSKEGSKHRERENDIAKGQHEFPPEVSRKHESNRQEKYSEKSSREKSRSDKHRDQERRDKSNSSNKEHVLNDKYPRKESSKKDNTSLEKSHQNEYSGSDKNINSSRDKSDSRGRRVKEEIKLDTYVNSHSPLLNHKSRSPSLHKSILDSGDELSSFPNEMPHVSDLKNDKSNTLPKDSSDKIRDRKEVEKNSHKYSNTSKESSHKSMRSNGELQHKSSDKIREKSDKLSSQSKESSTSKALDDKIANFKAQLGVTIDLFDDTSERTEDVKKASLKEAKRKKESKPNRDASQPKKAKENSPDTQSDDENSNNGMSFADALGFDLPAVPNKSTNTKSFTTAKDRLSSKSTHIDAASNHSKSASTSSTKHDKSSSSSKSSDKHKSRDEHKSSKHDKSRDREKRHEKSKDSEKRHGKSRDSEKSRNKDRERQKHKDRDSRKREGDDLEVPLPNKQIKLSAEEIVGNLPEISTNYKPLPSLKPGFTSPSRHDLIQADLTGKRTDRSLVYAGKAKQRILTKVPKLYDACLTVLKDNIDALEYVGGVPYYIMKPVLERCTATQLYNFEEFNPGYVEETDELWEKQTQKEFRNVQPEEFETWRELYLRKLDEREEKLKKLTSNISQKGVQALPVRQTKLAYVDTVAKPPRGVKRKQIKHGTAVPVHKKVDPLAKLSSHGGSGGEPSTSGSSASGENSAVKARSIGTSLLPAPDPVAIRQRKAKPTKAPMMMKSLKMMKGLRR